MKSKNSPKGMNARAAQRFPYAEGGPRQYRIEENIDMTPQKPTIDGTSVQISERRGGERERGRERRA
jgi:hypothetical protein